MENAKVETWRLNIVYQQPGANEDLVNYVLDDLTQEEAMRLAESATEHGFWHWRSERLAFRIRADWIQGICMVRVE